MKVLISSEQKTNLLNEEYCRFYFSKWNVALVPVLWKMDANMWKDFIKAIVTENWKRSTEGQDNCQSAREVYHQWRREEGRLGDRILSWGWSAARHISWPAHLHKYFSPDISTNTIFLPPSWVTFYYNCQIIHLWYFQFSTNLDVAKLPSKFYSL